jgi:hypothetical protein
LRIFIEALVEHDAVKGNLNPEAGNRGSNAGGDRDTERGE